MFEEQSDGTFEINMPCRNSEVSIQGKTYWVDQNGKYTATIKKPLKKARMANIDTSEKQEVVVSRNTMKLETAEVKLGKNTDNTIKIVRNMEQMSKGITNMGKGMQAEGQNKIEDAVCIYYFDLPLKSTFGKGSAKSTIVRIDDDGFSYPGCNKCDESCTEEVSTLEFATGWSDCAESVRLGVLYNMWYPLRYNECYNSRYCVDEAMGTVENKEGENIENIYCNGKDIMRDGTSKNGHINCSWFNCIERPEEAHVHAYIN